MFIIMHIALALVRMRNGCGCCGILAENEVNDTYLSLSSPGFAKIIPKAVFFSGNTDTDYWLTYSLLRTLKRIGVILSEYRTNTFRGKTTTARKYRKNYVHTYTVLGMSYNFMTDSLLHWVVWYSPSHVLIPSWSFNLLEVAITVATPIVIFKASHSSTICMISWKPLPINNFVLKHLLPDTSFLAFLLIQLICLH